jgi:hypothetical protein
MSAKLTILTIEDMQKLAKSRGGKCLSKHYVNSHTKIKWQCKYGHSWLAKPIDVKRGTWCPFEGGKLKLTIKEMRGVARQRNGKCLSKKYINAHHKLKWQCKKGHTWYAVPYSVKNGSWCPECARSRHY